MNITAEMVGFLITGVAAFLGCLVSVSTLQSRSKEEREKEDAWKGNVTNTLTRLETRQQVMNEQLSKYQQSLSDLTATLTQHTAELSVVGIVARRADEVSKKAATDLAEVKTDVRNLDSRITRLEK
jgi:hypothetical protein|nr:MAG TPA: hypothetical protein [Caudoviricetes sp.]DAT26136.1 MAG TPA: hypothetical protein [Caudoviricetes sp.]DAX38988.1 MAG TPA: hypothetical protein [Caudoviricetes sp.]